MTKSAWPKIDKKLRVFVRFRIYSLKIFAGGGLGATTNGPQ